MSMRIFGMEALVQGKVLILQTEDLVVVGISEHFKPSELGLQLWV